MAGRNPLDGATPAASLGVANTNVLAASNETVPIFVKNVCMM
jgi:hypothetical protein